MGKKAVSLKAKIFVTVISAIIIQFLLCVVLFNYFGNFEYIDRKTSRNISLIAASRSEKLESCLLSSAKETQKEAEYLARDIEKLLESSKNETIVTLAETDEQQAEGDTFSSSFQSISGNMPKIRTITAVAEDKLLDIMDNETVSGAFIILDTSASQNPASHSALYLRKTENGISVIYGNNAKKSFDKSFKVADEIDFSIENDETGVSFSFYSMPATYKRKSLAHSDSDFSYWAGPHSVFENDGKVISYSSPIIASDGTFIGIIGFEISEDTMKKLMPDYELASGTRSGYLLFDRSNGRIDIVSSIKTGTIEPSEEKMLNVSTSKLDDKYGDNAIFVEQPDGRNCYIYKNTLDIYDSNSYFADSEAWLLVGVVPEKFISGESSAMKSLSFITIGSSALIALLIAIIVTNLITSPVAKLMKTVENTDKSKNAVLERVNINEIDKLSGMIEEYSAELTTRLTKNSKIIDLTNTPIATFEVDKKSDKVFVSNSIVNILQLNPAIIVNGYIDKREWAEIYDKITSPDNASYAGSHHINKEKDNEETGQWIKINTFENSDYIIGVITDITAEILERKRIEYERNYDSLTGIINRRSFFIKTEKILSECKNAVVALWDISNLKYINETYGHENGDKLIKAATLVLDSVSNEKNAITARLSGDEFVTIIFGNDDVMSYKTEIKNLYELLTNVVVTTPDDTEIRVEVAVGTACFPTDAKDIKGLLRCTDSTLLLNKNENGRHSNGIFEYKE